MKVSVKSNINFKRLQQRIERADHILAVQAEKDTVPFVPMRTGSLTLRTKVIDNKIIYPGPYAHYLYNGKVWIDPVINAAGFLTDEGWKSRYGSKKIETDRNLVFTTAHHHDAQAHWFEASKALNLNKWLEAYKKELTGDD